MNTREFSERYEMPLWSVIHEIELGKLKAEKIRVIGKRAMWQITEEDADDYFRRMEESKEKRICLCCGKEFFAKPNSRKKFCSGDCRELYHKQQREPSPTSTIGDEMKCLCCGKIFIKKNGRQLYCSDECREEDKAEHHRQYMADLRKKRAEDNTVRTQLKPGEGIAIMSRYHLTYQQFYNDRERYIRLFRAEQ